MPDIRTAVAQRAINREELLREFPELADDEDALLDTLAGIDDLEEQIADLLCRSEEEDAFAAARAMLAANQRAREKKHKDRSDRLKAIAMWAARRGKISKVRTLGCSAHIVNRKQGPVIILSADAVPDKYCKIERTPKLTEIGEAIDAGEQINYAKRGDPVSYWVIR